MATTNHERVGKAMDLLRAGLAPFVEREFANLHKAQTAEAARRYAGDDRTIGKKALKDWDVAALLKLMWEAWNDVFGRTRDPVERRAHRITVYTSLAMLALIAWPLVWSYLVANLVG